jgi:hypothetical protein
VSEIEIKIFTGLRVIHNSYLMSNEVGGEKGRY